MTRLATLDVDHVLRDGTTVHVRAPRPGDTRLVSAMCARLSPETVRYRFGGSVTLDERWFPQLLGLDRPDRRVTRVATTGRGDDERMVAIAQLYRLEDDPRAAEFGALVEDGWQGRGIGTVLLRELAAIARADGIERLIGDVLANNVRMLRVIRDLGLRVDQRLENPYVRATFDVHPTETYLAAVAREEKQAATNAISRFLRPARIAVVGAGRGPTSLGGLVLGNLLAGGFHGPVYPVNPRAEAVQGVPAYDRLGDCPRVPDLVYVCVPADSVAEVIDEAGALGVHAVCVISSGFAETDADGVARQTDLIERVHGHGMRLVGPNCMGLLNGAADVRMNGTFSRTFPAPGRTSFLSQSGALGLSVLNRFDQLGLGLSSFISVGNKADVSGNDLLLYWEDDPDTDVVLLYLESFGNPRRFARIARRVGRTKPIVAVKAGRTSAGQRAASSHTAALASGDVAVDALFKQAGVIRTDSLQELLDAASLLATQPLPTGRRVGILTNGGGPGILAADAAEANGLDVPAFDQQLQDDLRGLLPPGAGTSNPVDMVASCTVEQYARAVETVAASGQVDVLLVVFVPPFLTCGEDVATAIAASAHRIDPEVCLVGVFMGDDGPPAPLREARIPAFAFPEDATRAIGHAASYAAWRQRPQGTIVRPSHVDVDAVREVVDTTLSAAPAGAWLDPLATQRVLRAYGVSLARTSVVTDADGAAKAQAEFGAPVAVKLAAPVHKRDIDAVQLGLTTPEQAATAVGRIERALRDHGVTELAGSYLVQEMSDGVEVALGVTHDPSFGPLVMVGLGGTLIELVRDVSVRITPLTDVDVDEMLSALRTYPLLTGYRGSPPMDVGALRDLLFRVNALVEDVPEVAELDLNPVFVRERGVVAVDARLRVAPAPIPARPGPIA